MKRQPDLTSEQIELVLKLRDQGLSLCSIKDKTGFPKASIYRLLNNRKITARPSNKIIAAKAEIAKTLRTAGKLHREIMVEMGLTSAQVGYLLNYGRKTKVARSTKCLLPECNNTFTSTKPYRKFCCKKCAYIWKFRLDTVNQPEVECINPTCHVMFKKSKINKHGYCSHKCAYEDRVRWFLNAKITECGRGVYKKIFTQTPKCLVCGEWRTVQEHHIIHKGNKSDKLSKTIFLCPNHHFLIHNHFATYTESEGYVELNVEKLKAELERKQAGMLAKVKLLWDTNKFTIFRWIDRSKQEDPNQLKLNLL